MFRQTLQWDDVGTQAPEWIALDKLQTSQCRWTRLGPNLLFCCESLSTSYTVEEGEVVFPTLPSFRLSYLLPALFADACTLAGGAYFLQSGFEQRSCSTHEHATRLSPFQKSQGVSSVHPSSNIPPRATTS